jgi:putative DNA primase/helicase
MQENLIQVDQERLKVQLEAAVSASKIWSFTTPADPNHPYLVTKRISAFVARQRRYQIVLPIIGIDGKVCSLQYINPGGNKWFLKGGAKKGNFIIVNGALQRTDILICEGFATGATLAELFPTCAVIAALDAGNLEPVAISIRKYRPTAKITICADDDRLTEGNPGLRQARKAAISSSALLAVPSWPSNAPVKLSDFNDLINFLKIQG